MELWSLIELILFVEYQQIKQYVAAFATNDDNNCPVEYINRNLYNEARLLIVNKDVIGYTDNRCSGIFTFIDAIKEAEKCEKFGKEFCFHPVNFTTENQYNKFFQENRNKELELL